MKFPKRVFAPLLLIAAFTTAAMSWPALGLSSAMAQEKKAMIYRCPMHPQIISDKPGDCPICHMRLVPVETDNSTASPTLAGDSDTICAMHSCPMEKAGQECPMMVVGKKGETVQCPHCSQHINMQEEIKGDFVPAGYSEVLISPQKQQLIGIKTGQVQKKNLERTLSTSARVAYDPELYEAQIDYLREYRVAQGSLRNRELAFKNILDSRWEAPRLDVAKSKLVLRGMDEESMSALVKNAKADEALLYLKPDGEVVVYVDIFESEAYSISKNDRVSFELPGIDKKYEAMVESVGSFVEPETRRVRLLVRLKNDGNLKPGMLLNATVYTSVGEGLAVSEEAIFFTGRESVVFVAKGNGIFEPREVRLGVKAGDDYQVLSGLREGENVVTNGNFLVDSESKLKASIEQATASHAGHGGSDD